MSMTRFLRCLIYKEHLLSLIALSEPFTDANEFSSSRNVIRNAVGKGDWSLQ